MEKQSSRKAKTYQPGVWSTDEYIREWAINQGKIKGDCRIPLQSLQHSWVARIRFDKLGQPVERIREQLTPA